MLNSSTAYDLAARGGSSGEDAVKTNTRTMLYREYNTILSPAVTVSPDPVDHRFDGDNVLNSRNPQHRGISYGPLDEFYFSEDPTFGYRFLRNKDYEEDREIAYYIPEDTASTALAQVDIDYGALYDMNSLQVRYDQTRNESTKYDYTLELYTSTDGSTWTQVWSGNTDDSGVTEVFYNGTDWATGASRIDGSTTEASHVRAIFRRGTDNVNPRVMYFGGLEVIDLDDDIVSLTVNKSEFEQSSYLPYGKSSSNTCSIELDNTAQIYRYGPTAEEDYLQKYQKVTVEFGLDVSRYGGSGIEYQPAGTYYIEDFEYNEETMTVSVNATDYSTFLKERMCDNAIWQNKSVKYIVKDVLARAGFSPKFCVFKFGIPGNADESTKRNVIWSHNEQTVWDFLITFIKSELGTVYFNENGELVVTDREYFRTNIDNGSQLTLTGTVDIESMSERYVIDANKIKIKYSDLGPLSTKFNPTVVAQANGSVRYQNLGERYRNNVLWSPDDGTFFGSTVLGRTLRPDSTHIWIPLEDENQISEEEGLIRIGRELIKYDNREITTNNLILRIKERGAHGTPINSTVPNFRASPPYRKELMRNRQNPNVQSYGTLTASERRGFRLRQLYKSHWGTGEWSKYFVRPGEMNYNTNYDVYGLSFTFNEIPAGYRDHQAAGLFINNNSSDMAWYFEVNKTGIETGGDNLIGYKSGNNMSTKVRLPPEWPGGTRPGDNRLLFAESGNDPSGQFKVGTPIEIMVYNDKNERELAWFVNGNLVNTSKYSYSRTTKTVGGQDIFADLTAAQKNVVEADLSKGEFGIFLRGSSDITVEYLFATNKDQFNGYDLLRPYNPATNAFERDWLPETFTGYYEEFGAVVHEAEELDAEHDIFPSLNPRLLNTLENKLHVHYQTHTPFDSKIVVSNNDRWGVNINGTNFSPDGTQLTSSFLVYGVPIVTNEDDELEVVDTEFVRKYGPSEIEIANDWIDSMELAKSLGNSIRAQWKKPVTFFDITTFPNPALQPGDRISVDYTEKGFTTSDIWIVTAISISYDGGLSGTLTLKRFTEAPPTP